MFKGFLKKFTIGNIGLAFAICLIVISASAHLIQHFSATQEGDITIIESSYGSPLLFDGEAMYEDFSVPLNITEMETCNGYGETHTIVNQHPTASYNITFSIDDSWFENESHPWYGFTYGVYTYDMIADWTNLTTINYILVPGRFVNFDFQYFVSCIMDVPETPVHIKIDIDAVEAFNGVDTFQGVLEDVQFMIDDMDDSHILFEDGTYFEFTGIEAGTSGMAGHIGEEIIMTFEGDDFISYEVV